MRATLTHPAPSSRRDRGHPSGMVLWLTLVAMLFFAALAAYVFNLGHHAARQQATQDAADAAATGGAGEIARTLNLVAQDNIDMTHLLVSAQMLDAMPQAVSYTLTDQQAHLDAVRALPAATCAEFPQLAVDANAHKAKIISDLQAQVTALAAVNQTLQQVDVRETTWYTTPTGSRGAFWKAMLAMDKVSQAAIEKMPVLAQAHAVACGARSLGGSSQDLAGAVPFRSALPCQRGAFDDFYKPVTIGQIPDASGGGDALNHRGPCDTLWGWVGPVRDPGTFIPGAPNHNPPRAPPSDGSPFGGGGGGGGGGGTFIPGPIVGYRTQGFFNHLNQAFRGRVGGPYWLGGGQWGSLPDSIGVNSELTHRVGQMAARKLMMAQNGAAPWSGLMSDLGRRGALPQLLIPAWLAPLDAARGAASNNPAADINRNEAYAAWARYEEPAQQANLPWTWTTIGQGRRYFRPRAGGRVDMFFDAPETAFRLKLGDGMYVTFNPEPIIDPQTGAQTGVNPTNPVYYFWAGINTGHVPVTIANPNNWGGSDEIPAPTDLLPEYATPPTATVPGQWCVLGFASRPNGATGMGAIFKTAGRQRHTGLAQARVFNNHSWDLWTPMWHAQLTPVEEYATWLATMQQTSADAGGDDGMNTAELPGLIGHLDALKPLAPLITH